MATTYNQNFESNPADSLPSGWVGESWFSRDWTAGRSGSAALTANYPDVFPNVMYATYDVAGPSGSVEFDASVFAILNGDGVEGHGEAGLAILGTDSPMTTSSSCLWIGIQFNASTGRLIVRRVDAGVTTNLVDLVNSDGGLALGEYYKIRVVRDSLDAYAVWVVRDSNGWMMDSSGAFVNETASAVSGLSVSSPPSGSYFGVGLYKGLDSGTIFVDDFSVTTEWPASAIPPRRSLVVPLPFQYYHPD